MTTEEMWKTVADVMNRQGVLDEIKEEVTEQVTEKVAGNTIKDVIRKLKQSAIMTNEQIAEILKLPLSKVEQA